MLKDASLQTNHFVNILSSQNFTNSMLRRTIWQWILDRNQAKKLKSILQGRLYHLWSVTKTNHIQSLSFRCSAPFQSIYLLWSNWQHETESWINLHINMFRFFGGGVSLMIVLDNLKTGIISHKKYEDILINKAYQEMAEYYDTVIIPARVKRSKDKASVESSVGILTNLLWLFLSSYQWDDVIKWMKRCHLFSEILTW